MSLARRFTRGISLSLVAAVFNQGSTFALNLVISTLLGKRIFGEFSLVLSTILSISVLTQVGAGYTVSKYLAEFRNHDRERAGRLIGAFFLFTLGFNCLACLALFFGAAPLAGTWLKAPQLCGEFQIGSAIVFFLSLAGFATGALTGLEAFPRIARAGVFNGLCYLILCTSLSYWAGLRGAVWGLLLSAILQFLSLGAAMLGELRVQQIVVRWVSPLQESQALRNFALPATSAGYLTLPFTWGSNALLVNSLGGYEQMGLYTAANNLRTLALFIPNNIVGVGTTMLNDAKGANNRSLYRKIFITNVLVVCAAAFATTLFLLLFGLKILAVYGKDFSGAYPVLTFLLCAAITDSLYIACSPDLHAQGRMWLSLGSVALPRDISLFLLAGHFIPLYGAQGLAMAACGSSITALLGLGLAILWSQKNRSNPTPQDLLINPLPVADQG